MTAKMLGRKRDQQPCCAGHDPLILGDRRSKRKWVRINRHREDRAWRLEEERAWGITLGPRSTK